MHKTSARCALCELVKCLLQPLRIAYNKPIVVTSGYRSPEVNRLAGGVRSSQILKHCSQSWKWYPRLMKRLRMRKY